MQCILGRRGPLSGCMVDRTRGKPTPTSYRLHINDKECEIEKKREENGPISIVTCTR